MAQQFNLTAQINLQSPKNVGRVVSDIQRQLKGSGLNTVNIKVKADPRTIAQTNRQLQNVGKSSRAAAKDINTLNRNLQEATRRFSVITIATGTLLSLVTGFKNATKASIEFERELIKISQVTGKSVQQLQGLTKEVTRLSTAFGVSSADLLNVSRTLAQAGFNAEKTRKALDILAKTTLAATFDNIQDTTEGAIALLRQFGDEAKRTGGDIAFLERSLDAINAVSKRFAVESGDLITVIRRVGGVFSSAGGEINELIALFTSVRATTRESAETIATGLRTIFTRIQRTETIDQLRNLNIELRDSQGNFVGAFEAVKRLSAGLATIDPRSGTFSNIVEELGGFRQIGKVIPLIQQFATAQDALRVAQAASGSTAKDAATAQQGLGVQIQKVREEFTALIRKFTDSGPFNTIATGALKIASAMIKVAEAVEPLLPLLTTMFGLKLGRALAPGVANLAGIARGGGGGGGRGFSRFARGGMVPGTGNRDTVPAMLTPGEFVIKKSSVKSLGAGTLAAMNNNRFQTGGKQEFPTGSASSALRIRTNKPLKPSRSSTFGQDPVQFGVRRNKIGGFILNPPDKADSTYIPSAPSKFIFTNQKTITSLAKRAGKSNQEAATLAERGIPAVLDASQGFPEFYPAKGDIKKNPKINEAADRGAKKGLKEAITRTVKLIDRAKLLDISPQFKSDPNLLNKVQSSLVGDASVVSTVAGYLFEGMIGAFTGAIAAGGQTNFDFPASSLKGNIEKLSSFFGDSRIKSIQKAEGKRSQSEFTKGVVKKTINDLNKFGYTPGSGVRIIKGFSDPKTATQVNKQGRPTAAARDAMKNLNLTSGLKRNSGGGVPASSDTVPALLTPGEFVFNKSSAQSIGYSNLNRMNKHGVQGFAAGGPVGFANGGQAFGQGVFPPGQSAASYKAFDTKWDEINQQVEKAAKTTATNTKATETNTKTTSKNNTTRAEASKKMKSFSQRLAGARAGLREFRGTLLKGLSGLNNIAQSAQSFVFLAITIGTVTSQLSGLSDTTKTAINRTATFFGTLIGVGATLVSTLSGVVTALIASRVATEAETISKTKNAGSSTLASLFPGGSPAGGGPGKGAGGIGALLSGLAGPLIIIGGLFTAAAVAISFYNNKLKAETEKLAKAAGDLVAKLKETGEGAGESLAAIIASARAADKPTALFGGAQAGALTSEQVMGATITGADAARGAEIDAAIKELNKERQDNPQNRDLIDFRKRQLVLEKRTLLESQLNDVLGDSISTLSGLVKESKDLSAAYQDLQSRSENISPEQRRTELTDLSQRRSDLITSTTAQASSQIQNILASRTLRGIGGQGSTNAFIENQRKLASGEVQGTQGDIRSANALILSFEALSQATKEAQQALTQNRSNLNEFAKTIDGSKTEAEILSGSFGDAARASAKGIVDQTNARIAEIKERRRIAIGLGDTDTAKALEQEAERIRKDGKERLKAEAQYHKTIITAAQERHQAEMRAIKATEEVIKEQKRILGLVSALDKEIGRNERDTKAIENLTNLRGGGNISLEARRLTNTDLASIVTQGQRDTLRNEINSVIASAPAAQQADLQRSRDIINQTVANVSTLNQRAGKGSLGLIGARSLVAGGDPEGVKKIIDQVLKNTPEEIRRQIVEQLDKAGPEISPEELANALKQYTDLSQEQIDALTKVSDVTQSEIDLRVARLNELDRTYNAELNSRQALLQTQQQIADIGLRSARLIEQSNGREIQIRKDFAGAEQRRQRKAQADLDAAGVGESAGDIAGLRRRGEELRREQRRLAAQAALPADRQDIDLLDKQRENTTQLKAVNAELERMATRTGTVDDLFSEMQANLELIEKERRKREQVFGVVEEFVVGGQDTRKALVDSANGIRLAFATGTLQNQTEQQRAATIGLLDKLSDVPLLNGFTGGQIKQELIFRDAIKLGLDPKIAQALATATTKEQQLIDSNERLAFQLFLLTNEMERARVAQGALGFANGGMVQYRAGGGNIFKPRGTDTVPAMLTPGEFVIQKSAVDRIGADNLAAINNGVSYLHRGGVAGHKHPHGAGSDIQSFRGGVADASMIEAAAKPEDVAHMTLQEYEKYKKNGGTPRQQIEKYLNALHARGRGVTKEQAEALGARQYEMEASEAELAALKALSKSLKDFMDKKVEEGKAQFLKDLEYKLTPEYQEKYGIEGKTSRRVDVLRANHKRIEAVKERIQQVKEGSYGDREFFSSYVGMEERQRLMQAETDARTVLGNIAASYDARNRFGGRAQISESDEGLIPGMVLNPERNQRKIVETPFGPEDVGLNPLFVQQSTLAKQQHEENLKNDPFYRGEWREASSGYGGAVIEVLSKPPTRAAEQAENLEREIDRRMFRSNDPRIKIERSQRYNPTSRSMINETKYFFKDEENGSFRELGRKELRKKLEREIRQEDVAAPKPTSGGLFSKMRETVSKTLNNARTAAAKNKAEARKKQLEELAIMTESGQKMYFGSKQARDRYYEKQGIIKRYRAGEITGKQYKQEMDALKEKAKKETEKAKAKIKKSEALNKDPKEQVKAEKDAEKAVDAARQAQNEANAPIDPNAPIGPLEAAERKRQAEGQAEIDALVEKHGGGGEPDPQFAGLRADIAAKKQAKIDAARAMDQANVGPFAGGPTPPQPGDENTNPFLTKNEAYKKRLKDRKDRARKLRTRAAQLRRYGQIGGVTVDPAARFGVDAPMHRGFQPLFGANMSRSQALAIAAQELDGGQGGQARGGGRPRGRGNTTGLPAGQAGPPAPNMANIKSTYERLLRTQGPVIAQRYAKQFGYNPPGLGRSITQPFRQRSGGGMGTMNFQQFMMQQRMFNRMQQFRGGVMARSQYRATGGGISGADTVPAMLTPGEFVMSAGAVRQHGVGAMRALNRGQVPGFNRGGMVGGVQYRQNGGFMSALGGAAQSLGFDTSAITETFDNFVGNFSSTFDNITKTFGGIASTISELANSFGNFTMTHQVVISGIPDVDSNALANQVADKLAGVVVEKVKGAFEQQGKDYNPPGGSTV